MPRGATKKAPRERASLKRASLPVHGGRNDRRGAKNGQEKSPQSSSHDGKLDKFTQGELRAHIIAISNLGAVAKFVLDRKPEIIPEVQAFTKQYPELLHFIQHGSCTEVIPQDIIPLFTDEWDDEEQVEPAAAETAINELDVAKPGANEPSADEGSTLTPGPQEDLCSPIQAQTSGAQSVPEKMVKETELDGLPEPPPDGSIQPWSPSAWMPYVQHPPYGPSWLPVADPMSMAAANTMSSGYNAQMFSAPFFFPSGTVADYGFSPGTVPTGPLHSFQQPHHGQAIPQPGERLPSPNTCTPSTSRSDQSTESENTTLSQSIKSGTAPPPDVEGFVPTESGLQGPVDTSLCQPWPGQARDITLSTSDDFPAMFNDLPSIIC
ncbi:uncharacterized protein BDV14DRAFT_126025 [Aspergillus stella-maris]|uniref:uncharacterized protein n=1 Tax=Aspergillus stella-maris TaxID=1810926 RepID=UPI003CCDEADD